MSERTKIQAPTGKLGVLIPGLGSVASTFIAGVSLARRGRALPIGSLTQLQRLRLGKRTAPREVLIKDLVPLAGLDDLVFGGWDPVETDAYEAARHSEVLPPHLLEEAQDDLRATAAWPAAFCPDVVRRITPRRVKQGTHREVVEALREDIRAFRTATGATRLVMAQLLSTEAHQAHGPAHEDPDALEAALDRSDPAVTPSLLYAYAAVLEGVPVLNGTPNASVDARSLQALAARRRVPVAGKDLKTGQTMMKTVLAPALQARMLGLRGWYSTNILGNRDGEVLDEPANFRSKEVTKRSVLEGILRDDLYPELYGDYCHKVRIDYYPPRGDQKEGWDNIDIVGWLGQPMQIKVNFLCRDSILAAPVVLDLVLFLDLAARAGLGGIQEWLSFYFKSPIARPGLRPLHDLFAQHLKLTNTLRTLAGEEVLHHTGLDYYSDDADDDPARRKDAA
ncbi:MAG: inositol-3-phosphate synthase [Planctomycetota bacterium]|nr:inositol-3-phosphate synthase [Planctomycetota bacterium]